MKYQLVFPDVLNFADNYAGIGLQFTPFGHEPPILFGTDGLKESLF